MVKNREINGTEEIGLVTPTPVTMPVTQSLRVAIASVSLKESRCDRSG